MLQFSRSVGLVNEKTLKPNRISQVGGVSGNFKCPAHLSQAISYADRHNSLRKKAEYRHSGPAAAGEESLLGLCFESRGILRFAQNDGQRPFSAN